MYNTYESTLNRITQLVALLSACPSDSTEEFGATVTSVSKRTGVSPKQIRKDLISLNRFGFEIEPLDAIHALTPENSSFDQINFSLGTSLPLTEQYESPCLVFMTKTEQELFRTGKGKILIKDSPSSVSAEVRERIADIEEALRGKKYIEFTYKSPSLPEVEHIKAAPITLLHNRTDDLWYCVVFPDAKRIFTYRLDRIKPRSMGHDIKISADTFTAPAQDDPRFEKLRLMWGADFSNDNSDPVHVKIRIAPNTANILNKIKSDISDRSSALLYEKDGFWFYEDDLYGLSSFRTWLMTFGSSVKVLEPKSLADQIIEDARKCLDYYHSELED